MVLHVTRKMDRKFFVNLNLGDWIGYCRCVNVTVTTTEATETTTRKFAAKSTDHPVYILL